MALPALVLLAAMLIWGVLAAAAQIRCVDAARVGARAAARGEVDSVELALAAAPAGARVRLTPTADTVKVDVDAPCAAPGTAEGGGGPWPS